MARTTEVPVTPEVVDWAIRESGHPLDDIAGKVGVPVERIREWARGRSKPTLTQARKLAGTLRRSLAALLLPQAPSLSPLRLEFRHPVGVVSRDISPVERRYVREAARLQRGLAFLLTELGEAAAPLPVASASDDPERVAAEHRRRLGVDADTQSKWVSDAQAARRWRAALENTGIVVLHLPLGRKSCRGFSVWHAQVPLIAVNTYWNNSARMFTLFHEYGHLVTRTDSICVDQPAHFKRRTDGGIERWCERFAAALLLPWDDVDDFLTTRCGVPRGSRVPDLDTVRRVARRFHVSLRAATIRLIERGRATWGLYEEIPAASEQKPPGGAGGRNRLQKRIDEYGRRTAEVFTRALAEEIITRTDALGYLNVADEDLDKLPRALASI